MKVVEEVVQQLPQVLMEIRQHPLQEEPGEPVLPMQEFLDQEMVSVQVVYNIFLVVVEAVEMVQDLQD